MNISPLLQLPIAFAFAVAVMTSLWFVQRRTRNAGIVDVAWAATIGMQGVFYAVVGEGFVGRRWLVGGMIAVWSLRLTLYLYRRVVGHPEEGRYAALRQRWGRDADRRMFWFYQMQAAAAFGFALPVFLASHNGDARVSWLDCCGGVLWLVGMWGVVLADRQLAAFRGCPEHRGRTCREGLWRYSRHPNYFFEWVVWWSYVPLALGATYGWLSMVVPLLLLYFFLRVTGIPPTEAQALASRGDDYRRYQQTTSPFIPWFPRKEPPL